MLSVDASGDLRMFLKVVYLDLLRMGSDSKVIVDKGRQALDFSLVNVYSYVPFNLFKLVVCVQYHISF
jgi:hypothetical protein